MDEARGRRMDQPTQTRTHSARFLPSTTTFLCTIRGSLPPSNRCMCL